MKSTHWPALERQSGGGGGGSEMNFSKSPTFSNLCTEMMQFETRSQLSAWASSPTATPSGSARWWPLFSEGKTRSRRRRYPTNIELLFKQSLRIVPLCLVWFAVLSRCSPRPGGRRSFSLANIAALKHVVQISVYNLCVTTRSNLKELPHWQTRWEQDSISMCTKWLKKEQTLTPHWHWIPKRWT